MIIDSSDISSFQRVWNKADRTAHPQGTLFRVTFPNGEHAEAVLAEINKSSAEAFYQLVQRRWDEFYDIKEPAEGSKANPPAPRGDGGSSSGGGSSEPESAVQAPQAGFTGDAPLSEEVGERLSRLTKERDSLQQQIVDYQSALAEVEMEVSKLEKVKEVLDAFTPENGGQASKNLPDKAAGRPKRGRQVGKRARKQPVARAADAAEDVREDAET